MEQIQDPNEVWDKTVETTRIPGGFYTTIDGYRKLCGLKSNMTIYKAIKSGRLKGAIKIGNTWFVNRNAVIIDTHIKHGGWKAYRQMKEEYERNLKQNG